MCVQHVALFHDLNQQVDVLPTLPCHTYRVLPFFMTSINMWMFCPLYPVILIVCFFLFLLCVCPQPTCCPFSRHHSTGGHFRLWPTLLCLLIPSSFSGWSVHRYLPPLPHQQMNVNTLARISHTSICNRSIYRLIQTHT